MESQKQKFGLFTTVAMIVGIVVGSGIFFKADDILISSNGNPITGALLLAVGAIGIVFGGLCVSTYASKSSKAGGLITYVEMAWGETAGYLAGWFQTIFYYPAITAILSWICAVYVGLIFGITDPTDARLWLITFIIVTGSYGINILNTAFAGKLQSITVSIKIIILLIISLAAFVFGKPSNLSSTVSFTNSITPSIFVGLIACAFSYDGWFIAPSIAHEIKDPKRNLVKALTVSPLIIMAIYLLYFLGITYYLGPNQVIALGDQAIGSLASNFLGSNGDIVVYLCIVISIFGTINGIILGFIRLPYSLAIREKFPNSSSFNRINKQLDIPVASAFLSYTLVLIWSALHSLSVFKINVGPLNFSMLQVDNLPIVLTYFFYITIYIRIIYDQIKHKELDTKFGYIFPALAILGALLVIYGGISQPGVLVYFIVSFIGIFIGYLLMKK